MRLHGTLRTAMRALLRNPTRAFLTTIGIVIGIAAVITMMEIGAGSSASIQKSIASMGAENILVMPASNRQGGVQQGSGSRMTLKPGDYQAIIRECPSARAVAPIVSVRAQTVWRNKDWSPASIQGSTADFLIVKNWSSLTSGQMFTDRDVAESRQVCVIGQTIVRELFNNRNPLGQIIRIKDVAFKVVGVLSRKGANMFGHDQDDFILMPWTTLRFRLSGNRTISSSTSSTTVKDVSTSQLYPSTGPSFYTEASNTDDTLFSHRFTSLDQIMVTARSAKKIDSLIKEITVLLRERHHLLPGDDDDFDIRNFAEMSAQLTQTTRLMTNLLLFVAMISLVVGGVGIMNIMLVSVTERTREIGLRMAVGARSTDILLQFLVESVVLCLLGGLFGIALGHGGSQLVNLILEWPVETAPDAIVAAVVVAGAVGIVFGFYPAWKASKLDPIDALRYE